MNKKLLDDGQSKPDKVKSRYLLVAAGVSGVVCVYSLRQNNLNMVLLRDEVFVADQKNGNVELALKNLQAYIYNHMNTNLSSTSNVHPPIQLKYTYERLQATEQERVNTANAPLYTQAQLACQQQVPKGIAVPGRVPCLDEYVSLHGGATLQSIPSSLYQFDFVSPNWTPDLAGVSLIVTIVLIVLLGMRYVMRRLARHQINRQV